MANSIIICTCGARLKVPADATGKAKCPECHSSHNIKPAYEVEDDDRPTPRRPRRNEPVTININAGVADYFTFRRMVTTRLIQFTYVILSLLVIIGGLYAIIEQLGSRYGSGKVVFAILFAVPFMLLFIRLWCEQAIVHFRINDTLADIRQSLRDKRQD